MNDTTLAAYEAAQATFIAAREGMYAAAVAHVRNEVLQTYPHATHIDLESSDQDTYGWCLLDVLNGEHSLPEQDEDEDTYERLRDAVEPALGDLPWDGGPVETDDRTAYGQITFRP